MQQLPLVSIIIPVYNAEQFLPRCIQSVVQQTYNRLEIILVDDGSQDGSARICGLWAERDPRIKVIHQENAGPAAARNTGLDRMTRGGGRICVLPGQRRLV